MQKLKLSIFVFLLLGNLFMIQAQQKNNTSKLTKSDYAEYPHWVDMMKDMSVNFYDVQEAFTIYFKDRPTGKGTGWKQFKRWEWFMEQRVYPSGSRLNHPQLWNEMKKFRSQYPLDNYKTKSAWEPLGPFTSEDVTGHWNPGIGRINVIARDPFDENILYIGAPSGGLWKTIDEGANWEVLTDHLPVMGVSAIAIHPFNTDIIYIGTGDKDAGDNYSIGVLKSIDGGYTWEETGLDWTIYQNRTISKLLINPDNPEILFAGTTNGLYKTVDAGESWYIVQSGNIDDIEFKPGNPNTVYTNTQNFYRSTDGGENFTQTSGVPTSSRVQIAVTEANPEYVYFFSYQSGIYRSTNSGVTFTQQSSEPNQGSQGWYDLAFAASHVNAEEVHLGEINTWRSLNGGVSWTKTTDWMWGNSIGYTHCDIHEMVFFGGTLYVGSDGLVSKSTDNGNTWTNLTEGICIRQFYRFGGSKTNSYKFVGGSQDNGTSVYSTDHWHEWIGADGMEALVDHTNENIVYGTSQGGQFYKSTSGGNFGNANIQQPGGGAWVTPFVMHPTDPETIFVGLSNVRKTTNGMGSWTTISSLGGGDINNMYISEYDPDYLYVSKSSSIYRTTDGGDSWDNISSGLPNLHISYIAVHPLTPETVAVCLSGYDNGDKVFISYDAGETWINFTENLPNIPANCVIFNNDPNDGLYVGMDVGCYYRDNSLDEWEPFMEGLPNVIVNEMEIHYESGKIRAATYGRGLWESDIHPIVPVDIVVSFNVNAGDDDVIEFGESVTLDIKLKNTMDIEADDINMTISIDDPFVEITDDNENFGSILPGDSITIADAFAFDVSSSVPDDYQIKFTTQISSSTDAWDGQIKLTAYAPAIEHGDIEIDDGDNGHLDPGETAIINMDIDNNGSISATDIEVTISTADPYVNISNTTASFDLLEPDESEEMILNFEVDATTPIGHVIKVFANITASNSYSTIDTIGFQVGTIMEDFETGDFSSYPWSFEGVADWEIINDEVYEGEFSARSGDIDDQQESIMYLQMEVLAEGEISFYKKVSCEDHPGGTDYDYLAFFIDADEQGRWDGEVDWSQETYPVTQGSHTFKWLYYKDYSVSSGEDCAWVDYIILPPVDQPVSIIEFEKEQIIEVYPNPFNNETVLSFTLKESQKVNLKVYNSKGKRLVQLINNARKDKGKYQIIWDGKNDRGDNLPSGIYFYQLTTDKSYSGKIILQR
ncbi:MAG: hypothetical protein DRJ05_05835 [Bacteroidetes bacterium]|nr:MAG: hypothetical protein DRJ05_05835 [Bacteroidota bacterium]